MANHRQEDKSTQDMEDAVRRAGERAAEQTTRIGQAADDQTARVGQAAAEAGEEVAQASANLLKQNVETLQNVWRFGLEAATSAMGHQLEKNMDHMNELWACRTPQDFAAVQSDMVRETVETALESSRRIADMSLKMVDDTGKQIKQGMGEIRRTA